MVIEIQLDYSSTIACFDSAKALTILLDDFPEASTDWKDQAEVELLSVVAFVQDKSNLLSREHGEQMIAAIRRKAWQNGPAFLFSLNIGTNAEIKGWVRRYYIGFESVEQMAEDLMLRIVRFLERLNFGKVAFR